MPALKLETFEIEQGGTPLQRLRSDILDRAKNDAYANGFKDGVNVTKEAVNAEQNRLLAAILESLSDVQIGRSEANASAVRNLRPVVEALVTHLAPDLAKRNFSDAVVDAVVRARSADADGEISLRVAPQQVTFVQSQLAQHPLAVAIIADDTLSDLHAEIHWGDGCDAINLDAFLGELARVCAEFFDLTQEEPHERNRDAN